MPTPTPEKGEVYRTAGYGCGIAAHCGVTVGVDDTGVGFCRRQSRRHAAHRTLRALVSGIIHSTAAERFEVAQYLQRLAP